MTSGRSTVLCPLDFSPASARSLALSEWLCGRVGARLVLEHNVESPAPSSLTVSRIRFGSKTPVDLAWAGGVEVRLRALVRRLSRSLECEARLSRGPVDEALLYLAYDLPADLVVMASHGPDRPAHRSLTERLVARAPCPVLATGRSAGRGRRPRAGSDLRLVVPLELGPADAPVLAWVERVGRRLPLRLEVVHAVGDARAVEEARKQLAAALERASVASAERHVLVGSPGRVIPSVAEKREADGILMARHRQKPWRLRRSAVDSEVLQTSPCPVCFVPPCRPPLDHVGADEALALGVGA